MTATSEVNKPLEERIGNYRVHPVAAMFPLLEGDQYEDLKLSIEAWGLQRPIVVKDGLLIDGRNRLRICLEIQLEARFVEYKGTLDVADYIRIANIDRRHLTEDQRAAIATQIYLWTKARAAAKRQAEAGAGQGHHGAEGGRGKKKPLTTNSSTGVSDEPKTKARDARSTVGQVAAAAKTSHHKAAQAVAVAKAAKSPAAEPEPKAAPDLLGQVATGAMKLREAYAKVKANRATSNAPPRRESSYLDDRTRLIGKIRAVMGKHPRKCSDLQQAIMKAINATPDAPMEYLRGFFKEMMRRRRETSIIAEKRNWRPDQISKLDLIKIIDWIEIELQSYISGRSAAPEAEQHPNESHKEETQ